MKSIIDYYESLTTTKKIIVLVSLIVIMLLLIFVMRSGEKDPDLYSNTIKYRKISTETLMQSFTLNNNDRDNYLVARNIVEDLRKQYTGDKNVYSEYYVAVDSNYKKRISKSRFSSEINSIMSEIANNDYSMNLYRENTTSNVYMIEIIKNGNKKYIGVQFNWNTNLYKVFYIG